MFTEVAEQLTVLRCHSQIRVVENTLKKTAEERKMNVVMYSWQQLLSSEFDNPFLLLTGWCSLSKQWKLTEAKCTQFEWSLCCDIHVIHICIRITVCIVVQFFSVDQPPRKQRAYQDWSSSRCFSSGSAVARWLESPASLPITALLNLAFTSSRIPQAYSH